jgi:hypothetical protein
LVLIFSGLPQVNSSAVTSAGPAGQNVSKLYVRG